MKSHKFPFKFHTLTSEDVGKSCIGFLGRTWQLEDFFGKVLPQDIGKRVYLNNGILQVENADQRDSRLKLIAISNIIGMMEDVKRKAGPALGMIRLNWPESRTYAAAVYMMYNQAVWLQNEMRRIRDERREKLDYI